MDDIKVLVVDDSAFMRNIITKVIESTPGLLAVGKAMNGKFALEKIPSHLYMERNRINFS